MHLPPPASAARRVGKDPTRFIQQVSRTQHPVEHSPLGKTSGYVPSCTPSLLFPISRTARRAEFGLSAETLPCRGVDIWNCCELSWLTPTGKPVVAIGEFLIPADLPNITESKSLKLRLNSLSQSAFDSREALRMVLGKDLSLAARAPAGMRPRSLDEVTEKDIGRLSGCCIDELDVAVDDYEQSHPELLCCDTGRVVEEQLYNHLLKSDCSVTGQSDWGTLVADYQGPTLDPASLLAYLVSSRQYQDLHEQCVRHIFLNLQRLSQPQALNVYTRYVRRGGLDINLYRSLAEVAPDGRHLVRQ